MDVLGVIELFYHPDDFRDAVVDVRCMRPEREDANSNGEYITQIGGGEKKSLRGIEFRQEPLIKLIQLGVRQVVCYRIVAERKGRQRRRGQCLNTFQARDFLIRKITEV